MSKAKSKVTVADLVDSDDSSVDDPDTDVPADDDLVAVPVAPEDVDDDDEVVPDDVFEGEPPTTQREHIKVFVIVKPENMRTSSTMSLFEMTEHNSIRATQISQWNNCMVDTTGLSDPIEMAKRELMMRRSPMTLRRHVGDRVVNGKVESYIECWSPNDMVFATNY